MKRLLGVLLSLILVCLALLVLAPSFINWGAYKNQASDQVRKTTGLGIEIDGDIGFSILPSPRFFVENASISAPQGGADIKIASIERLEVNVDLMPLFKKEIKVSSLTLVKPEVSLEALENGKLNVITSEIEAMMGGNGSDIGDGEKLDKDASVNQSEEQLGISLDHIRIKEGSFSYLAQKGGKSVSAQNINMDLSAISLLGPFEAQGSVFYEGHALNVDIKTGEYSAEDKIISLKAELTEQPSGMEVGYDGVIGFDNGGFSAQGQISVNVNEVTKALAQYNVNVDSIKDGALSTNGLLTVDGKGLSYKNVKVTYNNQQSTVDFDLSYSPFSYSLGIKTVAPIDIASVTSDSYGFKKAAFDMAVSGDMNKSKIKISSLKFDDQIVEASGAYEMASGKSSRPKLSLDVDMPKVDYDKIVAGLPKSKASASSSSSKTGENSNDKAADSDLSLALPFDAEISATIGEIVWNKKVIKGLGLKANILKNKLVLENLSVKDMGQASIKLSGEVGNLKTLDGLTSYIEVDSQDIRQLAAWLEVDTSAWPEKVKKAKLKVKATGSADKMDVSSNIEAMDAQIIASGTVNNPLKDLAIEGLALQVKHKNMAQAIQMLSSATVSDKGLQNPMDFYAKISQKGQVYTLVDVKGDMSGILVTGNAVLDISGKLPEISGKLDFGKITLQSVVNKNASSTNSASTTGGARANSTDRWSKEVIDTSALHVVNVDLELSAKSVNYGAWPLTNPKMKLKLKNGVLTISDLTAGVFGGDISMTSKVQTTSNTKEDRSPIYFDSASVFKGVDLGQLSKALIGTKLVNITGKGSLDLNLKASGASPAALVYDLGGDGKVNGTEIVLDGVDVTKFVRALSDESKPGDTVLGIWKGSTKGGQTAFETLTGSFVIENGVVNIASMDLDGQSAAIKTTGNINLPKWTLSTKHNLSIKGTEETPSDVPSFDVTFSGSLDNPSQTFGQGLLKDYLNRKIQRRLNKMLSDKLGLPSSSTSQNAATTPAANDNSAQQESSGGTENSGKLEDVAEEAIKGVLQNLLQ